MSVVKLTEADLPSDHQFKTIPYRHQLDAFLAGRDRTFYAYLMEMGTGKSKVLIDTTAYLFNRGKVNALVVLAPKSICRNWSHKEIPVHLPDSISRRTVLWGGDSKKLQAELGELFKPEPLTLHVLVMNIDAVGTDRGYDILERFIRSHDTLMAIDESTIIKNPRADRSKIVTKLGKHAKFRRIMTGSPVTQSPLDVYSQFEFLKQGCLGNQTFHGFRNQYALLQRKRINGREFDIVVGYQRLNQLQAVLQEHSYRVLKKDCLDLPDKIYETRHVELTAEQKSYYKSLKEDALATLSNGETVTATLVLTQLLRLRQCLCNIAPRGIPENLDPDAIDEFLNRGENFQEISKSDPRVDEVLDLIEEASDKKVIIWSNFVPSIKKLKKRLDEKFPGRTGCIYGPVPQAERQDVVERFQGFRYTDENGNILTTPTPIPPKEQLDYIIANPRTGGYGLTLTAATLVIYHDHDWSLEVREQSEDRAHRIGQTKNVTYVDIVAPGTIDMKVIEALRDKKNLAKLVTGDTLRELLT